MLLSSEQRCNIFLEQQAPFLQFYQYFVGRRLIFSLDAQDMTVDLAIRGSPAPELVIGFVSRSAAPDQETHLAPRRECALGSFVFAFGRQRDFSWHCSGARIIKARFDPDAGGAFRLMEIIEENCGAEQAILTNRKAPINGQSVVAAVFAVLAIQQWWIAPNPDPRGALRKSVSIGFNCQG